MNLLIHQKMNRFFRISQILQGFYLEDIVEPLAEIETYAYRIRSLFHGKTHRCSHGCLLHKTHHLLRSH